MSTPVAAGSGALARQYFMAGWYPTGAAVAANAFNPSGPLIKAVLMGEIMTIALDVSDSVRADAGGAHQYLYPRQEPATGCSPHL